MTDHVGTKNLVDALAEAETNMQRLWLNVLELEQTWDEMRVAHTDHMLRLHEMWREQMHLHDLAKTEVALLAVQMDQELLG